MKTLICKVAVMMFISAALFARVLAVDSSDPTDVNKLLSDGDTEVTVENWYVTFSLIDKQIGKFSATIPPKYPLKMVFMRCHSRVIQPHGASTLIMKPIVSYK